MSGDIFAVTLGRLGVASGFWWVEAREAANHPATHRNGPKTKNDQAQNVSSTETEKPGPKLVFTRHGAAESRGNVKKSAAQAPQPMIQLSSWARAPGGSNG